MIKIEYEYTDKIQEQQSGLALDFMTSLEEDDIDLFWSTLSVDDRAYFQGGFNALISTGEEYSFDDFKLELFNETKERFRKYINNYGLSTIVRYHNKMFADIYLPHGVKVPIKYIAEAETMVMKLPIKLEINLSESGELIGTWKVLLFANNELQASK